MSKDFYMIVNGNKYPAKVAWGHTKQYAEYKVALAKAERIAQDQRNAIGRFMKADKRRNAFATREEAQAYILKMGLPFNCEISEAFWM